LSRLVILALLVAFPATLGAQEPRPHVTIRGIYGGVPQEILDSGRSLKDFGVNAVWLGSGSLTPERMAVLEAQGVKIFAEFNTLHVAAALARRRGPGGVSGRRAHRCGREDLSSSRRLAGDLSHPRGLSLEPHGRVS